MNSNICKSNKVNVKMHPIDKVLLNLKIYAEWKGGCSMRLEFYEDNEIKFKVELVPLI